jgi:hypothetical protein
MLKKKIPNSEEEEEEEEETSPTSLACSTRKLQALKKKGRRKLELDLCFFFLKCKTRLKPDVCPV